jgi:hypothetical protein
MKGNYRKIDHKNRIFSMPEGLKICSTKSLEPRSYKCAVYTHRKDTKVTFPSEYYKCHTYIGQHGNTKYKFDQRNSNHRSFGNISSNEIMMALIESDEHDPIKDVETVGITLSMLASRVSFVIAIFSEKNAKL